MDNSTGARDADLAAVPRQSDGPRRGVRGPSERQLGGEEPTVRSIRTGHQKHEGWPAGMQQADGPASGLPALDARVLSPISRRAHKSPSHGPPGTLAEVDDRGHGHIATDPQVPSIQVTGCCAPNSTAAATSRTISATPCGVPWA